MGNIVQHFSKPKEDFPTPDMHNLTAEQVAIIKSTWQVIAASPFEYGEKILYAFFEKWVKFKGNFHKNRNLKIYIPRYPHNQQKFAAFKNTPLLLLKVKYEEDINFSVT